MDAICKITTNRSTTPPRATCRWNSRNITRNFVNFLISIRRFLSSPENDSKSSRDLSKFESRNLRTIVPSVNSVNSYRFPLSGALKSQHSWPFTTQPRRGLVLHTRGVCRFHVEAEHRIVPSPSQRLSLSYIFIKASKWRCNGVEQPGVMMFRRGPRPSREIPRVIVASKQQRSGGQRSKKCCHNTTTVHWPWLQRH